MSKKVRRLDLGDLQPAVKRGDGTIRVQGHLTKCGVFTYVKPDGSISKELRTPEEVHSTASLNSFSGIPVTNDHPPEMITADNAKQYTVGSLQGTPFADDDHVRGDLAIYDSATINAIKRGKRQLSLGYVCDLDETPGEHPVYGKYDAKQINIRGNHCAIVSTARAGSTARVRLDAAQLVADSVGTVLASSKNHAKLIEMAKALSKAADEELKKRLDAAKPDADDDVEDSGEEGDEDDDVSDSYDESENMDAAQLAPVADPDADGDDDSASGPADPDSDARIAAHTFAVPARKEMPIHSPAAVQTAMTGFGDHKFKGPDEKHAAFNRVYSKAIQFGVPRDARHAFQDTHGAKLDHADDLSPKEKMIELKKAKEALAAAVKRADAADQKVAKLEGQVESLKKDVDATKARNDASDAEAQKRMDAKLDLLVLARATGATVESTMTNRQIHSAVIKHVDKIDIADDKHDAYVEAVFDGAVSRAKTDAVETLVGKNAIAAVRAKAEGARLDTLDADKNDAEDFSEAAAARRLKARTESAWISTVKEKN